MPATMITYKIRKEYIRRNVQEEAPWGGSVTVSRRFTRYRVWKLEPGKPDVKMSRSFTSSMTAQFELRRILRSEKENE